MSSFEARIYAVEFSMNMSPKTRKSVENITYPLDKLFDLFNSALQTRKEFTASKQY
jgi:hypothetical protein